MGLVSISQAIAEFDVRAWASRHGGKPDGRAQRVMLIDCPFCLKSQHLWVSVVSKQWHCFVCLKGNAKESVGGKLSVIALVKEVERTTFALALDIVARNAIHVSVNEVAELPRTRFRRPVETKRNESGDYDPTFWEDQSFEPKTVPFPESFHYLPPEGNDYTRGRGFPFGSAYWYRLGVCTRGWLRNRLVFPVFYREELIYWVARDMTGREKKRKYLNLPSKRMGAVGSKEVLLNMDRAGTVNNGRVVLVEGPASAAIMGPDAVASFGKTLSGDQIARMMEYGYKHITVAWDGDAKKEARDAALRLSRYLSVSLAEFPGESDPGDVGHEECRRIVAAARPIREADVMDIPELS